MPATILFLFGAYLAFSLFEFLVPAERGQSVRGRVRNIGISIVYFLAGAILSSLILIALVPSRGPADHGLILTCLLILLSLLCADMLFYWYHRTLHSVPALWPIHQLHHSDTELNVTTSQRFFWLENPLQALFVTVPASYMIRITAEEAVAISFIIITWLLFIHSNLRLQFGKLSRVVSGPQVHRIHHSRLPEHRDHNFAQFFPVLDMIFGTYHHPKRDEFPPTGTAEMASDVPWRIFMLKPLKVLAARLAQSK